MGSGSGGGGVDESHLGEDDDEEGEMINDIKGGGNGCDSQKLIRRKIKWKKKIVIPNVNSSASVGVKVCPMIFLTLANIVNLECG